MATKPAIAAAGAVRTRHFGTGHLVPLDGLRGVAILAVMASHLFAVNYAGSGAFVRLLGQVFYYGWMGVDLFFVLSGFLITGILVDSREGAGYFKNFYMRRVLRIFPLYYGVLFLLLALTPALGIRWHGIFVPLLLYLQNFQNFNRYTYSLSPDVSLNHLWSLAIEEQFYLVWPLLVYVARTRRRVLVLALCLSAVALGFRVVLMAAWGNAYAAHHSMFARADALLLGAALAMLFRDGKAWAHVLRWAPPVCIGCVSFVMFSFVAADTRMFASEYWIFCVRFSVVACASGGLLAWSLRPGAIASMFSLRLLRFFGKYSYGLYVLHVTFLPLLSRVGRTTLYALYPSKAFAVAGTAAFILAASSGAAWISFQIYEKQFLRLKQYFDYPRPARPVS